MGRLHAVTLLSILAGALVQEVSGLECATAAEATFQNNWCKTYELTSTTSQFRTGDATPSSTYPSDIAQVAASGADCDAACPLAESCTVQLTGGHLFCCRSGDNCNAATTPPVPDTKQLDFGKLDIAGKFDEIFGEVDVILELLRRPEPTTSKPAAGRGGIVTPLLLSVLTSFA